jgi:RHS repeat-associated protein
MLVLSCVRRFVRATFLVGACLVASRASAATTFQDVLVQPPNLAPSQRGSLAGTLSRAAFGAGDLARGAFKLPLPIDAPNERGPLLAGVVPSYSAESGLSEWGAGWQADLSITRFRSLGELDFATDELTSPWGRLVAGEGGYYPAGLASVVRVNPSDGGWVALTSDGTRYTFRAADAVVTARGTYRWMLSRVDTLLGDATTLVWTRNASGRPFLASVQWGGRGDGTQYQMMFDYEAVPTPIVSYASGAKLVLDQRVKHVTVAVQQGSGYATRWRYDLTYLESPTGPAFYLQHITRIYASGTSDSPVVYDYDLGSELRASAPLQHVTGLDSFFASHGGLALQPDHAAQTDLDQDGLTDLETAFDQSTLRQTPTGFVVEALPSVSGANPTCRPAPSLSNKPRMLARMHGDTAEPQVVWVKTNPDGTTTRVLVCDRLGVPIYDNNLDGTWGLNENARLADLDMDRRPDIVRVRLGKARVLRNTSTSPSQLSFALGPVTDLSPQFTPVATWVLDFNGDGRADLMVRSQNSVVVWLGIGGGQFESTGTTYGFRTVDGLPLANFSTYQLSHGDFNGDGLSDVVLTRGQTAVLFTNRGGMFVETPVAHLSGIPFTFSFPLVADLAGSGNDAVVFINDQGANAIDLTSPSTGLLRSADDGKGTVLRFSYGRARPAPGVIGRHAVLAGLTIESSGYDTVSYSYDYGAPVLHSAGKYLVGFDSVDKRSPFLTEHVTFLNDDDISGVHSLSEDRDDRTAGIVRFTSRQYDDVQFHGVRWLRPSRVDSGYRSADATVRLSTTTQYTTYERGACPTVVAITTPSGQLVRTTTLATIAAIPDELHCLATSESLYGTHSDSSLDFHYLVDLTRNNLGQVTCITQLDPAMDALVLQDIAYDADHRIASTTVPGRGTAVPSYDNQGRLAAVTDPLGITTQVGSFDPITDALLDLQTARPLASSTVFFQYDGKERLQASWDDFSGASQAQPIVSYAYQDATSASPGRINTQTLADAITGVTRDAVDLFAADGEPLVAGTWLGDKFSLGISSITSRNTLTKRSSFIGTMTSASLSAITSADLRGFGTPQVETVHAGFGHPIQTTTTQQASVVGTVTSELLLGTTELVTREHQPGGFTAESAVDAAGRLVRKTDETGATHHYTYDALGRLVHIDTPDGGHTLTFDGFGRPARVTRDGIGAVTYAYDATTGLLVRKQRFDASGTVTDTSETHYDAAGRPVEVSQTADADASNLIFDYDGQLGSSSVGGQLGRLSRVHGDGWERSALFDPLGRPYFQHTTLTGWRELTNDKTYRADGSVASDALTVADPGGSVKFSSTKQTVLDGLGRIGALKIDGAVLYTLSYDGEGRLARADFTSGEAIVFDYDPVTHAGRGHEVESPDSSGSMHWDRDPRGLIAVETYVNGATTTRRDYSYDGRGALTRASTATNVASYTYTASGLPDSISDTAGTRTVRHTSETLAVGDASYTWDAAGRVIAKNEWRFDYGANGQLAHASRPGRQIDFVYDDGNNRLLKRVDGAPVRATVAGGVLTENHFIELVTIGGVVAGVLDNGQFTALLTDPRGTPFAGPDGTPGLATPYGVRTSHVTLSEVIDYARLGWDPDLDVVRMGVRDYDPKLSQFLTPDPLFLEDLDACSQSAFECNLYSYARNNPISFVDLDGHQSTVVEIARKSATIEIWKSGLVLAQTLNGYGKAGQVGASLVVVGTVFAVVLAAGAARTINGKEVFATPEGFFVASLERSRKEQALLLNEAKEAAELVKQNQVAKAATTNAVNNANPTTPDDKERPVGSSTAKPRFNKLNPDPSAEGPHTTFKTDPLTGKVTGHAEWDAQGNRVKRVDVTGASHGGVDTPHTHEYGPPNVNPSTGQIYPGNEIITRPATSEETPR